MRRQLVQPECLVDSRVVPLAIFVIEAFGWLVQLRVNVSRSPLVGGRHTGIGMTFVHGRKEVPVFLTLRTPRRRRLLEHPVIS